MKNYIMVIAGCLLLAACKKDRTCNCTDNYGGTGSTYTVKIVKSTKAQAKANCVSSTKTLGSTTETIDCKLD